MFTADIIFALHRAVVVRHHFRRRLLGDGRLIFRAYLLKGTGLLDVVTTLPFWAQSFAILIGAANSPTVVKALLGLRVLRLLRVVPAVSRMFDLSASDIGRSLSGVLSSTALYLGALIYTAAVLVNMLSCLWYFVARVEGAFDDPKTWIDGKRPVTWLSAATLGDAPLAEASKSKIYLAGAYFSVTTLTTVGYGDITPKTSLEHGVAIGVMFVGILFFSFVVNSMGAALASSSAAARRSSALRAKFAEVEAWARARALPPALRRRIMEYYGEVWVRKEEWREADLYGELPAPLRADVTRALALDVFRASDLLASAPEPLLHDLAAAMEPVTVFPGHDLCEQGEEADGLWVMHEGELLVRSFFSLFKKRFFEFAFFFLCAFFFSHTFFFQYQKNTFQNTAPPRRRPRRHRPRPGHARRVRRARGPPARGREEARHDARRRALHAVEAAAAEAAPADGAVPGDRGGDRLRVQGARAQVRCEGEEGCREEREEGCCCCSARVRGWRRRRRSRKLWCCL